MTKDTLATLAQLEALAARRGDDPDAATGDRGQRLLAALDEHDFDLFTALAAYWHPPHA